MKKRNIAAFCSIAAALLAAGGIYAAAWSPVLTGALDFALREEGDRAALAGFTLTGKLTDGAEETLFSVDETGVRQQIAVVPPGEEEPLPLSYIAGFSLRPGNILAQHYSAEPEEGGYYNITCRAEVTDIRLLWQLSVWQPGDQRWFRMDTGLTNPKTYTLYDSFFANFEEPPTEEEIAREFAAFLERNLGLGSDNPIQQTIFDNYGSRWSMSSTAQVGETVYFTPAVSREWEGPRRIYRLDRTADWEGYSLADIRSEQNIGSASPIAEIEDGGQLDILGLYATLDGTLVLCVNGADGFAFRFYRAEDGAYEGSVIVPELLRLSGGSFCFFPDENGFCAGFSDGEGVTLLTAVRKTGGQWQAVHPVRALPFRATDAVWRDGQLAAAGTTGSPGAPQRYRLAVYGAGEEPLYRAEIETPAGQDYPYSVQYNREMAELAFERSESDD